MFIAFLLGNLLWGHDEKTCWIPWKSTKKRFNRFPEIPVPYLMKKNVISFYMYSIITCGSVSYFAHTVPNFDYYIWHGT